jgi:hypothetical protein
VNLELARAWEERDRADRRFVDLRRLYDRQAAVLAEAELALVALIPVTEQLEKEAGVWAPVIGQAHAALARIRSSR